MANPTLTPFPTPPLPEQDEVTFNRNAANSLLAQANFVNEGNIVITWMGQQIDAAAASKKAAADSATAAGQSAESAATQAGNASTYAGQAMGYRDSAQTAAAAAQSAAGMPSISGKADFMLSVNATGNGVEWRASVPRPTAASAGKVARVNASGNAYELGDGSPISKYFESAKQQVVYGGSLEVIHGLGAAPKIVSLHLICNTASNGYKVGDRIEVSVATYYGPLGTGGNNNNRGCQVWCDATKIYIKIASQSYFYGADGSFFEFNSTNFSLVARASA